MQYRAISVEVSTLQSQVFKDGPYEAAVSLDSKRDHAIGSVMLLGLQSSGAEERLRIRISSRLLLSGLSGDQSRPEPSFTVRQR